MLKKLGVKLTLLTVVTVMLLAGCTTGASGKTESKIKDENTKSELTEQNSEADTFEEEMNPVADIDLSGVTLTDYEGNELEDVFASKKLTVLNLWGTFCGPCIDEMPELQKFSEEYTDKNVQVIGYAVDVEDDTYKEDAKAILEQTGATFDQIMSKGEIKALIGSKFDYVPATLFVDENGKVLSTMIPGGTTYEDLERIVDKILAES